MKLNRVVCSSVLFFIVFITFFSCIKNNNSDENNYLYSDSQLNNDNSTSKQKVYLHIPYKKLETFLGNNFIPIYSFKSNLDNDIDEEVVIAYKKSKSEKIIMAFFDIYSNGVIRKNYEFITDIVNENNFNFQSHNLLYEDDVSCILEGKTREDKWILYIIKYDQEKYIKIGEFLADYSIIMDYIDIDKEDNKYTRLKEITTIDNSFSATNTSIQKKNVYIWDYETGEFKLIETTQILTNDTPVNRSYLANSDKFFEYIDGFWYPEDYKYLINSNSFDPDKYDINNIEFISFSKEKNEVYIKHSDYINLYAIIKANLVWGQKPGLRLKVQGISKSSKFTNKDIEIFLISSDKLQVVGPNKYDEFYYIRLPRPFIEYVNEKKEEKIKIEKENIMFFLSEEFVKEGENSKVEFIINFTDENKFIITKDNKIEKGYYKLTYDSLGYIITFMFDGENSIIKNFNYIIDISKEKDSFKIIPVKISFNGFVIDDIIKSITLKKRNKG